MKRVLALLLVVVFVAAACSSNDNGGVVGGPVGSGVRLGPSGALRNLLPATIGVTGVLKIGSDVGRAPLLFYATGTTQPQGMEYELLQALGRQLGVTIQVVNTPLANLPAELKAGKFDAFMSGFVDLKAFQEEGVSFIDYLTGRTSVLVRNGNPGKISGPDGLCGMQVGVQAGTAQQVAVASLNSSCTSRGRPALQYKLVATHTALLTLLTGGQVAAALDDAVVGNYTAQESLGASTVEVVGAQVDPLPYGIGVTAKQTQLTSALQQALAAIIKDGEYDEILAKWGGEDSALRTDTVNAGQ